MIIVDTNVVAELMKASPAQAVVSWLNDQEASALFLTTITIGEIGYGLEILPQGKRRLQLEQGFARILGEAFAGRILAFDEEAARIYGALMGKRKQIGRPLSALDGQIAAIARATGSAVATRNIRDFVECGVEIINPFDQS
ncbi:MAG TPA: type II toxin-antitoxin system VapC family toxin [Thermoanaerobaculia bacterium]|nr:type II toxin-antitoxin system VapC family toxin [Thermoanaerobaculia bacterium]